MAGKFVFLLLVISIQLALVNGHRRCNKRRHKCLCGRDQASSSDQSIPSSFPISVPTTGISSTPPTFTSKSTKMTQTMAKSTITPSKSEMTKANHTARSKPKGAAPCDCPRKCPSGWTLYNENCYKLNWGKTRKTQIQCHKMCRRENSHLVSIHSRAEHKWLYDFVTKTTGYGGKFGKVAPVGKKSLGFWIGAKPVNGKDALKGPWYWTDQPNEYLKPEDYAYERDEWPWAHRPDKNPAWTKCSFMWIVDPRPNHRRGSWDDAACDTTESASSEYANGGVCKRPQICECEE